MTELDPEKVRIAAAPFPLADLVALAEAYARPGLYINFPQASSNITLHLETPGLLHVDLGSWLSAVPRKDEYHKDPDRLANVQVKLAWLAANDAPPSLALPTFPSR